MSRMKAVAIPMAYLMIAATNACGPKGEQPAVKTDSSSMAPSPAMAAPDAQMQAVLDELAALGGKPIETLSAEEARKQPTPADAVKALLAKQGKPATPEPVGSVVNRKIPGPAGQIAIRIYTPKGNGPFPVVVYYHGGGWVIADLDVYDASPRAVANAANAVVVSAEYRKAPENPFPAAHDDAFAAYRWVIKNAASIKGDPARIAVMGESAGGNLAASVAMMARDSQVMVPVAQVLVYPVGDADTAKVAYRENENAKPLNKAMMLWFADKYLPNQADRANPRVAILNANLANLPAATIINAQIDPLRSDGEMLADKLRAAGVAVEQKTYAGVTHEFFGMGAVVDKAKDAVQMAASGLKKGFDAVK